MRLTAIWTLLLSLLGAAPALAAGCFPIAQAEPRLVPATFTTAALPSGVSARLTFLGHASFLIESPQGITAVTDYNDYHRPAMAPTIATMNNAHSTHFSYNPQPGIVHLLPGWNAAGGPAEHDIIEGDMRVRNVPTAVHGRGGDQALSNSIFVFEIEDLCIAHLGHLHHVLLPEQLAELGIVDVLLAPIDGRYTMSQSEMVRVIEQISPSLVIPMHYFGPTVLNEFLGLVAEEWEIVHSDVPWVELARSSLPERQVLVLPGR
jgi:L-ascorbate metabolism protein UlaG (beta-lactamase superfamily)